jgi:hypothetical protein
MPTTKPVRFAIVFLPVFCLMRRVTDHQSSTTSPTPRGSQTLTSSTKNKTINSNSTPWINLTTAIAASRASSRGPFLTSVLDQPLSSGL